METLEEALVSLASVDMKLAAAAKIDGIASLIY
jgi:hypothetical protein